MNKVELKNLVLNELDSLARENYNTYYTCRPKFKYTPSKFLNLIQITPFIARVVAEKLAYHCNAKYEFVKNVPTHEGKVEAILNHWKQNSTYGQNIHDEIELGLLSRKVQSIYPINLESNITPICNTVFNYFDPKKLWCTEFPVFSKEYDTSGIIDAIFKNSNNTYDIVDWKTLNVVNFSTIYDIYNRKTFKYPFMNYYDTKFNRYLIQLNYYKNLFEIIYNRQVENLYLMIFNSLLNHKVLKIGFDPIVNQIFSSPAIFKHTATQLEQVVYSEV